MNYLNKIIKQIIIAGILSSFLAIPAFAVAPSIATDAKLQYNKGVDFWKLGQLEESVECFKKAVDLDPNYIDAYYNLGILLQHLKQDDAALNVFKQIMLRKPDDYEAVYKAAELSKNLGEYDKAKMYLSLIPQESLLHEKSQQLKNSMNAQSSQNVQNNNFAGLNTDDNIHSLENSDGNQSVAKNNTYSNITSPTGVVTDNEGNVFVAGYSDNTIYKIDCNGNKIVYIKDAKIDGPIGMAIDTEGNIYLANYNKNNVLKITKTGIISEFVSDIQKPYCMYISNNYLYVSAQGSNSVLKYRLDN